MKKIVIVYYSWSNGNTERIAKMLQSETGGDQGPSLSLSIRRCCSSGEERVTADALLFIFAISIPITYNVGNLIIFTQTKRKSEIPHELYSNGSGVEPEQRWLGGGLQGTSL